MNRLYGIVFLSLFASHLGAQGYTYCNEVVGATGAFALKSGNRFSWTVGEPAITTLHKPLLPFALTQGFHQPEFCQTVAVVDPALERLGLSVFPNPAVDAVHLFWDDSATHTLWMRVFHPEGSLLEEGSVASGHRLPCGHWPPGLLLLQLTDPASGATAVLPVVRTNR